MTKDEIIAAIEEMDSPGDLGEIIDAALSRQGELEPEEEGDDDSETN